MPRTDFYENYYAYDVYNRYNDLYSAHFHLWYNKRQEKDFIDLILNGKGRRIIDIYKPRSYFPHLEDIQYTGNEDPNWDEEAFMKSILKKQESDDEIERMWDMGWKQTPYLPSVQFDENEYYLEDFITQYSKKYKVENCYNRKKGSLRNCINFLLGAKGRDICYAMVPRGIYYRCAPYLFVYKGEEDPNWDEYAFIKSIPTKIESDFQNKILWSNAKKEYIKMFTSPKRNIHYDDYYSYSFESEYLKRYFILKYS